MIGQVLKGKYRIYEEVGSGGFATVYVGRNLESNEIVAIKVLGQMFSGDARYVDRFLREAKMAERLHHPNIVRVLDYGFEGGANFLVMEFVEGLTLQALLKRKKRLSVQETISCAQQVCAGLQAAYQAGIVHRDIKPANLMITPDGTVKIMDFGIARAEAQPGLTQTGMVMGTPRYLSPEMAQGAKVDTRSDIYALGLVMYEMLTGAPPFDAETPWAIIRKQIVAQPVSILTVRRDVPDWLDAIIARAMAKAPDQRFQTPAEMQAALQEHARPAEASGRAAGVDNRLVLALAGVAAALVLALAALMALGLGLGRPRPSPAVTVVVALPTALPAATATPVVLVVTSTPGEPMAVATSLPMPLPPTETAVPIALLPTGTAEPTATSSPTAAAPTARPTKVPTQPPPTAAPTSPPAPTVSGKIVFSAGGLLHIVNAATGRDLVPPIPDFIQPDLRADGQLIIAKGFRGPKTSPWTIDARTGAFIREETKHPDDYHFSWAPDGGRFAYDSRHHGLGNFEMLYIQGLANPKPQPEVTLAFEGTQIRGSSPVWMRDDWIAFTACDYWPGATGGSNCGLYRMPSWGGPPVRIKAGSTDMRVTDDWAGKVLVMSRETGDWEVWVMSAQGGGERNLSQSPSSNDGLGTFSPDGNLVAFASNRGGGWAVWVVRVDGTGLSKLFDLPGPPTADPPSGTWTAEQMSWGP